MGVGQGQRGAGDPVGIHHNSNQVISFRFLDLNCSEPVFTRFYEVMLTPRNSYAKRLTWGN